MSAAAPTLHEAVEALLRIHDEPAGFVGKRGKELDKAIQAQQVKVDAAVALARAALQQPAAASGPAPQQVERAKFEAWCHEDDKLGTSRGYGADCGDYDEHDTRYAWQAWQARAALEGAAAPAAAPVRSTSHPWGEPNDDGDYSPREVEAAECLVENIRATAKPVAWMVYTEDGQSVYVTDNPRDIATGQRALPLYTEALVAAPAAAQPAGWFTDAQGNIVPAAAKPVPLPGSAAAQPAQQPLTPEQIEEADEEALKAMRDKRKRRGYCEEFTRAIERRHGIGAAPGTEAQQ